MCIEAKRMDYEAELRAVLARYLVDESRSPMASNNDYTVHHVVEMLLRTFSMRMTTRTGMRSEH